MCTDRHSHLNSGSYFQCLIYYCFSGTGVRDGDVEEVSGSHIVGGSSGSDLNLISNRSVYWNVCSNTGADDRERSLSPSTTSKSTDAEDSTTTKSKSSLGNN